MAIAVGQAARVVAIDRFRPKAVIRGIPFSRFLDPLSTSP